MTFEIILVFIILSVSVIFLIAEWFPYEVVALLVLGSVAVSGLVSPAEALAGFSNPAVITVWAVFILSSGLTRTGVANIIGRWVLKFSGKGEAAIIAVIMLSAGFMSAFMNNVAVAALMLPVVRDISRQTGHSPSRLMLPLAYGSLLGGLTTQIGTPPNLLVSNVLSDNGLKTFGLFDFTPVGAAVMLAGVAFVVLVGRRLLPRRNMADEHLQGEYDLEAQYHIRDRISSVIIPPDAAIVGKSLADSRIGTILGLNVIGITRGDVTILSPGPSEMLKASDHLIVEGNLQNIDRLKQEISHWGTLNIGDAADAVNLLFSDDIKIAEAELVSDTGLAGQTIGSLGFRTRFGVNILAVHRGNRIIRSHLQDVPLETAETLLVQGRTQDLTALKENPWIANLQICSMDRLKAVYDVERRLLSVKIPEGSMLVDRSLKESRLGVALGVRVLSIRKESGIQIMPEPDTKLAAGDLLLVEGTIGAMELVRSLSELMVVPEHLEAERMETETVGFMEAILSPHSKIAGKTLAELNFREKYGLTVLSIWREGKAYREKYLRDMQLRFGDALLLYGLRKKFHLLGSEPDFLVLTEAAQEVIRLNKAKISTLIMAAVLLPVVMGWIPIYITTLVGAAFMVITGCLTMEEAHRSIEWKGIILIAGMLPLGTALSNSGAAQFLAEGVVNLFGRFGPFWIMAGLMMLTFLATCVIPTAALVVLMGPIVINTAGDIGISPQALMMAVAIAASASFMTPISHPANIMVMGPGGYRFSDYMKLGIPLTLTVLVTALLLLPVIWPM